MKHLGKLAILGAFIVASASFASATSIAPGGAGQPSVTSAPDGTLFGTDSGTITAGTFTASFLEDVYEGGTNSLCPTCLAFAFTFTNNGPASLEALAVSSFLGYTTDADYVATGTNAPNAINETTDGTINYNWIAENVAPTTSGDEVIIYTNATADQPGLISLQDSTSGYTTDLAPAPTPEPGTLFLLGTGLLGAAGVARRKFAAKFV